MDSGNALFKSPNLPKNDNQQLIKAEGIIGIYSKMAFDAVNVGPKDLAGGISFLKDRGELPWISANLYDSKGLSVFPQFVIKDLGSLKIAVIGVTISPLKLEKGYIYKDWQDTMPGIIAEVENTVQFIVLLSTYPPEVNTAIAERYSQIRVIISADHNQGNIQPRLINNALLTQTADRGKYLGYLTLSKLLKPQWYNHIGLNIRNIQQQLQPINYRLNRLQKIQAKTTSQDKLFRKLTAQKEDLVLKLNDLKNQENDATIEQSKYIARFIALGKLIEDDLQIQSMVEQVKDQVAAYNKKRQEESAIRQLSRRYNKNLTGYKTCGQCHELQMKFWLTTSHANAITTLKSKGEEDNSECIVCHVTQEPELFEQVSQNSVFLLNLPKQLQAVGCESCHGAGRIHAANPEEKLMDTVISPQICLNCHTSERDDDFNYASKRSNIACPAI